MVYRSDISVCLLVANTFWLLQDGDDEEDDNSEDDVSLLV